MENKVIKKATTECKQGKCLGSEFSKDGQKRHWIQWGIYNATSEEEVLVIMKNPSGANGEKSDRTTEKLLKIARNNGYGRVTIMNTFDTVATEAKDLNLFTEEELYQEDNISRISQKAKEIGLQNVIFAMGAPEGFNSATKKLYNNTIDEIKSKLGVQRKMQTLGLTKKGYPKHPLFLSDNIEVQTVSA